VSERDDPVNVAEYEPLARERIRGPAWDYIAGGAGDEQSISENVAAFSRLTLWPHVLVDVARIDTTVDLLGTALDLPILLAPTAFQTLAHPDGEKASARAAAAAGTAAVLSTFSAYSLEEVAAAAPGPHWFQLYCYRERSITRRLVERAEEAGYRALCVTVDLPVLGRRERELRSGLHLPPEAVPRNFIGLVEGLAVSAGVDLATYVAGLVDPTLTWEIVDWLRSVTSLPIVLKGILRGDDAGRAIDQGADGVIVSNHGGRQLDTTPATIDALPEVVEAVAGRAPVLVDGGVRRGTDIVKALALGARAVLIGRPYVWGLAVDGAAGVTRILELLRVELEVAMALCGARSIADVEPSLVRPARW